jgi:tRNA A37 methylthiotransferase MiaB
MGRAHYDPAAVRERIEAVRTFWPLFGLGADIMVGFPGESEEEHRQSLDFVRSLPLSYAHVFAFSGRPGTAAARLPDLPCRIKRERARTMRELMRARRREFFTQVAQRPRLVLAPDAPGTARDREVRGVSEYYAVCRLRSGSASGRSLLPVRPVGVEEDCVLVEAVA